MTRLQLQELLKNESFPAESYSLNGDLPNEAYCLNRVQDNWEVYYSERGGKTNIKFFSDEGEACGYLYSTSKSDLSIKSSVQQQLRMQ